MSESLSVLFFSPSLFLFNLLSFLSLASLSVLLSVGPCASGRIWGTWDLGDVGAAITLRLALQILSGILFFLCREFSYQLNLI